MASDIEMRIRLARTRAAEAAERTARAHEHAAEQHERHADVAEAIGESISDAHRSRELAQRLRASSRHDREIATELAEDYVDPPPG
jgi:hypothetical protein